MSVIDEQGDCTLWFCVKGETEGAPSRWAQVLWGPSFDGSTLFEVSARFLLGIGTLLHYPLSGVGNQLGYAFDFEFVFDTRR